MAATADDLTRAIDKLTASLDGLSAAGKSGGGSGGQQAAGGFLGGLFGQTGNRRAGDGNTPTLAGMAGQTVNRQAGGGLVARASRGLIKASNTGSMAGTGTGAFLKIAGAAGLAAGVLVGMSQAVSAVTDRLIQQNREYAKVSASMAMVMAQRDVREMQRDKQIGDDTSESARRLAASEQNRKDAAQPLVTAIANLQNDLMTAANDIQAEIIGGFADLAKGLKIIPNERDKPKNVDLDAGGLAAMAEREHQKAVQRGERWFNRPPS